ncbi:hypothetical protein ACTXPD_04550 [Vreelandella alkaliphila]|uniref:hypothetical protein n=1 Tax=Vreelandella alkaliphila TaxID=272774 RepID=UPI003FD8660D
MAALDYLRNHDLHAEPLPGERLYVWPSENITDDIRIWIKSHKAALLRELIPANDNRRMAWRILRDGKPLATLVGGLRTHEEAVKSARSRWPNWNIEVRYELGR